MPAKMRMVPASTTPGCDGIHFATFSPAGRDLVERHVQFVLKFMPMFSPEFIRNILNTTFIEWERLNKRNIEDVLRIRDPDEIRIQMDALWELFLRNVVKFILDPEHATLLAKLKEAFFTTFANFVTG